jgi:hypothetical protein
MWTTTYPTMNWATQLVKNAREQTPCGAIGSDECLCLSAMMQHHLIPSVNNLVLFFWAGDDHVNGGQCKVAWEEVCAPISKGGLGFRCLHSHDIALLMKFLSKLHSNPLTPWETWFGSVYGWSENRDLGDPHRLDSVIWKDLLACLPAFRNATSVTIGSGTLCSF